jgi:PKHD-type hydroxylase
MNLKEHYWFFQSALPPKLCKEILEHGKNINKEVGIVGGKPIYNLNGKEKKEALKELKTRRNSNVAWLNDPWIFNQIHPYIYSANKNAGWNFEWDWTESAQFTIYGKGQYYNWHCDSWDEPYNNPQDKNVHGKCRKLSVTVSLNDSSEYKGGELEFDLRNKAPGVKTIVKCNQIKPMGSIVVFPSFIWHRVTPVTKGTRYSLVMWNLGYPFK